MNICVIDLEFLMDVFIIRIEVLGLIGEEKELGFSVEISENQQGVLICISNGIRVRVYDFEYEYYVLI